MAYSVLQGVQSPNAGQGLLDAFSSGQDIRAKTLSNQARQQSLGEGEYQSSLRKIQIANKLAQKALTLPPEGRMKLVQDYSGALQAVGFTPEDLASTPLDDAGLQNLIAQTDSVLGASGANNATDVQQAQYVEGLGYIQQLRNGQVAMAELSPDQQAKVKAALDAQAGRQAEAYGLKTRTGLEARAELEPELKRSIKEEEQGVIARTEPQIKASEKTATQSAEQRTIYKTQALAAAENMPTIKRAIQLQEEINSGGGANALRKVANYLGVSSADEGELNSLFGQNILGQLKSTFGGNPTEGERLALEQAQASFSQTGKINIRLLNNAMKLAELRIRRGKQAAQTDKDEDTLKYIDDAISIDFSDESQGGSGAGAMTQGINSQQSTGGWSIRPLGQ
jgi:hypothetical protein